MLFRRLDSSTPDLPVKATLIRCTRLYKSSVSPFADYFAVFKYADHRFVGVCVCYILFAEAGHENMLLIGTAEIIGDVDLPVFRLLSVGIGYARSFVEQEAIRPGGAIVFGDKRHQVLAAGLDRYWPVFYEQEIPAVDSSDEKPCTGMLDSRGA